MALERPETVGGRAAGFMCERDLFIPYERHVCVEALSRVAGGDSLTAELGDGVVRRPRRLGRRKGGTRVAR